MESLKSIEEFYDFLKKEEKQLLFKHSTVCPISAKAYSEFKEFLEGNEIPSAVILVREDRAVSNETEKHFGITHQSPQIFLIEAGKVSWNTSHSKITKKAIKEAL